MQFTGSNWYLSKNEGLFWEKLGLWAYKKKPESVEDQK